MPHFGTSSTKKLKELDIDMQMVLNEAIKHFNISIVCTYRGMEKQNTAFNEGKSKKRWPTSKHNTTPPLAFDIVPYPAMYEATYEEFLEMATHVLAAASQLGVPLKWGGHWKNYTGKGKLDRDWAHFEKLL